MFIPCTDYAISNKLTPFISMQNHYNLVYREEEREMMPTLKVNILYSCYISVSSKSLTLDRCSALAVSHGRLWPVVY